MLGARGLSSRISFSRFVDPSCRTIETAARSEDVDRKHSYQRLRTRVSREEARSASLSRKLGSIEGKETKPSASATARSLL